MANSILLVEDNEDNRIIYATALRYAGYEVFEAITGTEGVQQARSHRPDLVLMDISVPELDGWEATAILKADPTTKHIPIIAVTAHALPGDEERSLEAGCDGYLAKPIPPAALIAEIDRRFGRTTPSYQPSFVRRDDRAVLRSRGRRCSKAAMPIVPFSQLPDSARIWVFGSDQPLMGAPADTLLASVDQFLSEWRAHGVPLRSARDWRDDRFLAVGVDVNEETHRAARSTDCSARCSSSSA